MEEKLVVFIDTTKFKSLAACHERLKQIGFTKSVEVPTGREERDLGENDILVISNSTCSTSSIDYINNGDGRIYIIPDYKIDKLISNNDVIIVFPFRILHHTATKENYAAKLNKLKEKSISCDQQLEEQKTIYAEIANLVCSHHITANTVTAIIEKVKGFDRNLEGNLNLLHEIYSGKTISQGFKRQYNHIIEELKEQDEIVRSFCDLLKVDFKYNDQIHRSGLTALRDAVIRRANN